MNELKPCPFCGGRAKEHAAFASWPTSKVGVYVECESCGASTTTFWSGEQQQEAANAWNDRLRDSEKAKLINKRIVELAEQIEWYSTDSNIDWEERIKNVLEV